MIIEESALTSGYHERDINCDLTLLWMGVEMSLTYKTRY